MGESRRRIVTSHRAHLRHHDWRLLGKVSPTPAIQNNYLHTYLALDARRTTGQRLDGSEVVTVETRSLAQVTPRIGKAAISD